MGSLFSILGIGFVLGMRHATDPDHLIAVTTIVSRERSIGRAALIGVIWGIGHTLTIVAVGGAIIVFGVVIPPRLGLTMEFSVGVMLVLLGLLNLTGITPRLLADNGAHAHAHTHGDFVHDHAHRHEPEAHGHDASATPLAHLDHRLHSFRPYQVARPLVIGVVHGLAGSAAVALLVLAAIPEPRWGLLYLILFGAGTISGMMLITTATAVPFAYTADRMARFNGVLAMGSGVLSLVFGAFLVYDLGIVKGLFGPHPRWTPP
jgi:high-affinity nickel-transport protein